MADVIMLGRIVARRENCGDRRARSKERDHAPAASGIARWKIGRRVRALAVAVGHCELRIELTGCERVPGSAVPRSGVPGWAVYPPRVGVQEFFGGLWIILGLGPRPPKLRHRLYLWGRV